MAKKKLKFYAIAGHNEASRLAAKAEDLLKANRNVGPVAASQLDVIEREASLHQAGSKEAALFQLGLLARTGDRMAQAGDDEIESLKATHDRLVKSLATYLEAITGVNRNQCGLGFYFGPSAP